MLSSSIPASMIDAKVHILESPCHSAKILSELRRAIVVSLVVSIFTLERSKIEWLHVVVSNGIYVKPFDSDISPSLVALPNRTARARSSFQFIAFTTSTL